MLSSVLLAALASSAIPTCKVENAVYQQRSAPLVIARFQAIEGGKEWPQNLAMRLDFKTTSHVYWWLPWDGGTSEQQHLRSTTDVNAPGWSPPNPPDSQSGPVGDVSLILTDSAYNVLQNVPSRGQPAPAHFLIPDLREAVWYQTPFEIKDSDARQFFDFVSCADS